MVIYMWTSLNRKIYIFLSIILFLGLSLGIIFVLSLDESVKEILFLNINNFVQNIDNSNISAIVVHLVILSTLLILSILVFFLPLVIFFIIYNGFSLGFIISSLSSIFGLKGFIFSIFYIFITKLIFIIVLILYSANLFKISKSILDIVIYKKNKKDFLYLYLKRSIIYISIILLSDIILYFGGAKLIKTIVFLIK